MNPIEAPPKGSISVDVTSTPAGAEVRKAKIVVGTTPMTLAAFPGETVELDVRKPGYLPAHRSIAVGTNAAAGDGSSASGRLSASVPLVAVQQFEGTWQLAGGELRKFARRDDQVDVYKVTTVDGEHAYMKTYQFALADAGVVFGGDDTVSDPRAPTEPSCNVRLHVAYHYDPVRDLLEQERERVTLDFVGGKCIVQARKTEPSILARVDTPSDAHDISAPVGTLRKPDVDAPVAKNKPPTKARGKTVLPLDPKAKLEEQAKATAKATAKAKAIKASKAPPPSQNAFDGGKSNAQTSAPNVAKPPTQAPQNQVMPQPQAPGPQANEPIPQAPQQQAPIQKK
jgi:hypothetical protein